MLRGTTKRYGEPSFFYIRVIHPQTISCCHISKASVSELLKFRIDFFNLLQTHQPNAISENGFFVHFLLGCTKCEPASLGCQHAFIPFQLAYDSLVSPQKSPSSSPSKKIALISLRLDKACLLVSLYNTPISLTNTCFSLNSTLVSLG